MSGPPLRVCDRVDPTGAAVYLYISAEGRPLVCRADRPRLVGTQTVLTPWSGLYAAFREWKGMRVASRVEISWTLPEGEFTYHHSEVRVIEKLD
jgi:hypothetical protein